MGRCRSTPGLVESKGKIKLEDMVVGPRMTTLVGPNSSVATLFDDVAANGNPSSLHDRSTSSSATHYGDFASGIPLETLAFSHQATQDNHHQRVPRRLSTGPTMGLSTTTASLQRPPAPPKPGDLKPTSSYLSLTGSIVTRPVSPYQNPADSPFLLDQNVGQFPFGNRNLTDPSQEDLLAEIRRLRERVVTLESDNATMSLKLSQNKWEMQNRLADLELHICNPQVMGIPPPPPSSVGISSNGSDIVDENERNRESMI